MNTPVTLFGNKPVFAARQPVATTFRGGVSPTADSFTLSKPVHFGSRLDKNPSFTYNLTDMIDYFHMAQIQRAFTQQSLALAAQGDKTTHLTFFADMHNDPKFPAMLNGMADAITMTDRPVDVAIKSYAGPMALKMLVSATGQRYMYPEAELQFGEPYAFMRGTQQQMNFDTQIFGEDQRTLEWEIMQTAGVPSRDKVRADLQKGDEMKPLMALAYGSRGLIDAVIVGEDELLTRRALDSYVQENGESLQDFVRQPDSMEKVVAWSRAQGLLEGFDDTAITSEAFKLSKSVLEKDDEDDKKADGDKKDGDKKSGEDKSGGIAEDLLKELEPLLADKPDLLKRLKGGDDGKFKVSAYSDLGVETSGSEVKPRREMRSNSKPEGNGSRLEFENVPEEFRHVYGRDAIFFANSFNLEILHTMTTALQNIIEKKQKQKADGLPVSNGLIVENSPGGYLLVLDQWLGKINTTDVPFDVVVQGWGTSCGSMLINGATGNRFVTPNGHSLIHQLSSSDRGPTSQVETSAEGTNRLNKRLRHLISTRTGRPSEEVKKDMQADLDLNSVEMLLYGSKGFADAILVGPDKVLTRDAVFEYVADKLGGADKVVPYFNARLDERRDGDVPMTFERHKEVDQDPLANPLAVIKDLIAQGKAVSIDSVPQFRNSLGDVSGDRKKTIDYIEVSADEPAEGHAESAKPADEFGRIASRRVGQGR